MEDAPIIQIDDFVIVGAVVIIGGLIGLALMRAMKWQTYPYWILLAALAAGVMVNTWLGHIVQPRF
jgi:hypothetical protein